MTLYRLCDLVLETDMPLIDVAETGRGVAQCRFVLLDEVVEGPTPGTWVHDFRTSTGIIWISVWRGDDSYVLRFPDLADFVVDHAGTSIIARAATGVPMETVRHLLLGQVMPFVLSLRGDVVLHASSVESPAGAVGFLGASKRGKSTLTASLARRGYPLLADDCLLVRPKGKGFVALPGYGGIRLWPDSVDEVYGHAPDVAPVAHYTDKLTVRSASAGVSARTTPAELCRIYLLDPIDSFASAVRITQLGKQEAFFEYLKHAYRLDPHATASLGPEFARLTELADAQALFRLEYPKDFGRLGEVQDAVLADCGVIE